MSSADVRIDFHVDVNKAAEQLDRLKAKIAELYGPLTATYAETGEITVIETLDDGSHLDRDLGTLDANDGEWTGPVDEILDRFGYIRTGDWDGDVAPVRRA